MTTPIPASNEAETIARALGGKRVADGWICRCPAHNDDKPSLSVKAKTGGGTLFQCFAGCDFEIITAELSRMGLWQAGNVTRLLTKAEREKMDREQAALEAKKDRLVQVATQKAQSRWERATEPPDGHPYVQSKKLAAPIGARVTDGGHLLLPIKDANGALQSVQVIDVNGDKHFQKDAPTKGGRMLVGGELGQDAPAYLAEGWATAVSIHEATGKPVLVSFNLTGLSNMAREYPDAAVCADRAGLERLAVDRSVYVPPDGFDDFNDLAVGQGLDAVKNVLEGGPVSNAGAGLVDDDDGDGNDDGEPDGAFWSKVEDPDEVVLFTPLSSLEGATLPPRQWLCGTILQRGEITSLVAPTASGKSTVIAALSMSMAIGKNLLGFYLPEGALRVAVWNLEDDREEISRQLVGAAKHYEVKMSDIDGRLTYQSGLNHPLCTVEETKDGVRVITPVDKALRAVIERDKLDVLIIDPFVKSHNVNENDNRSIDIVARTWKAIAADLNIAIVLVHHTRKLNDRLASADDSRGASSLSSATRTVIVIQPMTKDEATALGVPESEREHYFRLVNAKSNRAPKEGGGWFKKVGVALGNKDEFGRTDFVAVAEPWKPKDSLEGVTEVAVLRCLERIHAGPDGHGHDYDPDETSKTYRNEDYPKPLGDRFTAKANGGTENPRWAGNIVMDELDTDEDGAVRVLKKWLETGLLTEGKYLSPASRRPVNGLSANLEKQRVIAGKEDFVAKVSGASQSLTADADSDDGGEAWA